MAHLTGSIGFAGQTSEVQTHTAAKLAPHALGTVASDGKGNEFIYLNFGAAKAVGELVTWDADFLAAACGATTTGFVGIVCGEAISSDLAGWVQVKGINTQCLAGSAMTSGFLQVGATTDGYSVPIVAGTTGMGYAIVGMNAVTSPSTATSPGYSTAPSSILGVYTARLNYPYIAPDIATS